MITLTRKANAVIFDDHKIFADSFSFFLESLDLFKTVHCFTIENELIRFFMNQASNEQNFLFVDYYLSEKNGLSIVNDARRLCKPVKIIVVSSVVNALLINDIVQHKPDAFLSKSAGLEEVLEAIKAVENGQAYISPYFQQIINANKPISSGYTDRELELLQYFAKGYTIEATAKALYLSAHTVIAHRKKMMRKSNCKSIIELLAQARQTGLI
ncbi:LuxR C-terminal-related transcriptional regulator [Dyadobacter sp. BHUBP1]|uniref:helix-turn-helix transcriptional regulator n=1 Tax=Dyadobacter sp. BHUBP1 TaxID=3424178 RepID=UPI003D355337